MIRPTLLFRGPVETLSGYGGHSRDLLKCLFELDLFDIKIDSCPWGQTPMTALNDNDIFHLWIKNNIVTYLERQPDIYVQVTVPNEAMNIGKWNCLITAGIETTMIPKDWIVGCNLMDLIIVPSQFSKNIMLFTQYSDLQVNKINKEIEVLFEGAAKPSNNLSNTRLDGFLNSIQEDFCYLFVGHWLKGNIGEDRKDVGMLIRTFAETFANTEDMPALILKTSSANFSVRDRERLRSQILNITAGIQNPPSIYLLFGELSDNEMHSLYNHSKVKSMVSFTKGEGFGRPLLEFTFTGKPVIASNWSGHLDFLNKDESILLDGELKEIHDSAVDQFLIKGSKWFQVNYLESSKKLIDVKNNYDIYLEKSMRLGEKNIEDFSLEKMKEKLGEMMKKHINIKPKQRVDLPELIRVS